jgi:hypothetical protein
MRILYVIPSYLPAVRYGGPIYATHGLCKGFGGEGHDVQAEVVHRPFVYRVSIPNERRTKTADSVANMNETFGSAPQNCSTLETQQSPSPGLGSSRQSSTRERRLLSCRLRRSNASSACTAWQPKGRFIACDRARNWVDGELQKAAGELDNAESRVGHCFYFTHGTVQNSIQTRRIA